MEHGLIAILTLAFGLGLVHALDADHIMAVSGLAARHGRGRAALGFCLRWAFGHGLTLFGIGGAVLWAGAHLPAAFGFHAEVLVGLVLIWIGYGVLRDVWRQSRRLRRHRHPGYPAHTHWHHPQPSGDDQHDHRAVLVGMLHGAAGSAPLLVLLPITRQTGTAYALLYLLVFSLAMLAVMLVFGGLLSGLFARLQRAGERSMQALRGLIAAGAMAAGAHLIHGLAYGIG